MAELLAQQAEREAGILSRAFRRAARSAFLWPENAVDLYINESVYWANVPNDVYAMTIGGYPVIKKWLSYREYKVLGRALKQPIAVWRAKFMCYDEPTIQGQSERSEGQAQTKVRSIDR